MEEPGSLADDWTILVTVPLRARDRRVMPRGLNREQAAAYIGVGVSTFGCHGTKRGNASTSCTGVSQSLGHYRD